MEAGGHTEKKQKKGAEENPKVANEDAKGTPEVAKEGAEGTPKVAKKGAKRTAEVAKEGAEGTPKVAKKGAKRTPEVAKEGAEGTPKVAKEPRVSLGRGFKIEGGATYRNTVALVTMANMWQVKSQNVSFSYSVFNVKQWKVRVKLSDIPVRIMSGKSKKWWLRAAVTPKWR